MANFFGCAEYFVVSNEVGTAMVSLIYVGTLALSVLVSSNGVQVDAFSTNHVQQKITSPAFGLMAHHQTRDGDDDAYQASSRRHFLSLAPSLLAVTATTTTCAPLPAHAQMVQFPCNNPDRPLLNTYHFMRVGTTVHETQDIWSTNPLLLTNRENPLSPQGRDEVVQACQQLLRTSSSNSDGRQDLQVTTVRYSLGAASMDTANIIGYELQLGRDRLVPEDVYLDPRSIGAWDRQSQSVYEPIVWALDHDHHHGSDGSYGRPPPHEDGTSDESLEDPMIRLRQLMSALETQCSGDTILLVFADGTTPAVLSCMMAGIPVTDCHALEFQPGEVRQEINYATVNELFEKRKRSRQYLAKLERGRNKLDELTLMTEKQQESSKEQSLVVVEDETSNLQDAQYEAEQRQIQLAYEAKVAEQRKRKHEEEQARLQLAQQNDGNDKLASSKRLVAGVAAFAGASVVANVLAMANTSDEDEDNNVSPSNDEKTTKKSEEDDAISSTGALSNDATSSSRSVQHSHSPSPAAFNLNIAATHAASNVTVIGATGVAQSVGPSSVTSSSAPDNGDNSGSDLELYPVTTSLQTTQSLEQVAHDAMTEYMNRDDGEEAWLSSIQDILLTEDDDDEQKGQLRP